MTHNEKVLALLSDGESHSHREMYSLYVMAHSRVADLRKQGHDIRCWREGDVYLYRLLDRAECDNDGREKTSDDGVSPRTLRSVEQAAPSRRRDAPSLAACSPLQLELTVAA